MARFLSLTALFLCSAVFAKDAWFSAAYPANGRFYPITARIHTEEVFVTPKGNVVADSTSEKAFKAVYFSSETQYRSADTAFSMHTTGVYRVGDKAAPVWQNTIRDGLYQVEWSYRDYTEKPAAVYWRGTNGNGTTTFENDALPEEFLYIVAKDIDAKNKFKEIKVLSPVWELPFAPAAWLTMAKYTEKKLRIDGVDCYSVLFTRSDGATAEYFITLKGAQVWRFQTFKGVWFERVQ